VSKLKNYLKAVENEEIAKSIEATCSKIIPNYIENFDFQSHKTGLLLGEVQSGKTGQMFGVIAGAADAGFEIFILLTTDNIRLQEQTFRRALGVLDDFCVCSENDEIRFIENKLRRPVIIILKKNYRVLERWRNNLSSSGFLSSGGSLFIVDDEGDAASLNTLVNKDEQSTINFHLESIRSLSTSSIYLQVTATPQSLLLQTQSSGWQPSFVFHFPPGKRYLGGDFFYSEPSSYAIRLIDEDELDNVKNDDEYIPEGLSLALFDFLVTAAHTMLSKNSNVCNFLIHPSIRIADHESFANKIGGFLNQLLIAINDNKLENKLREVWFDLQKTKPDIIEFKEIHDFIHKSLNNSEVNIIILNSNSPQNTDYENGINVIVGGNTLGRGVTFKKLQTIYYCRKSKTP